MLITVKSPLKPRYLQILAYQHMAFKYLLKIFEKFCPLTGINPMGKTNHKEIFLQSDSSLLAVGGREATLGQMTTVPMLWGHAFAEVYFWAWGVSKTDNEKI